MPDREALIFLHVPKTAGTTLRGVFRSRYRASATYVIGNDINADIVRFTNLDAAARARIRLMMGHMSFGLHDYLPSPTRYVSVLRDPVERVLSEYRFLRRNRHHPFHQRVASMSVAEYLESDFTGQASDGQTRLLSGSHESGRPGIAGREPLGRRHLEQALRNIDDHFAFVGIQERFEESLLLMSDDLNWRVWPLHVARNLTPSRNNRTGESPDSDRAIRVAIEERNALDIALYRTVADRIARRIEDAGGDFANRLARFRRWNCRYQSFDSRRIQYSRRLGRLLGRVSGR